MQYEPSISRHAVILCLIIMLLTPNVGLICTGVQNDEHPVATYSDQLFGIPPGWSDDSKLSFTNPRNTSVYPRNYTVYPQIAVSGNYVHTVWESSEVKKLGATACLITANVTYSRSVDNGHTWSKPIFLSNMTTGEWNDPHSAGHPQVAVNGSTVHVVWDEIMGADDIFRIMYRRSLDNGDTWGPIVNITPYTDTIWRYNPDIAVWNETVHIVWDQRVVSPDDEIFYIKSTDNGESWNEAQRITFNESNNDSGPIIAVNDTNVHVVWGRPVGATELMYMRSLDNGISWQPEIMLTPDDGWYCLLADIDVKGSAIHIVFGETKHRAEGGKDQVYYINSTDNGVTFNPQYGKKLSDSDIFNISGQPSVTIDGDRIHVVFSDTRDNYPYEYASEIYYTNSTDGGITWSPNLRLTYAWNMSGRPAIAVDDNYIHIAFIDNRTGGTPHSNELFYKRYPDFPADITPPTIIHASVIDAPPDRPINITSRASDNVALAGVWLNYTDLEGIKHSVPMIGWDEHEVMVSGLGPTLYAQNGNYSFEIPGQGSVGVLEYFIWANDTSGNANQSMNYTVQIIDVTGPVIDHTPLASAPLNSQIEIVANVTDDVGVANVTLTYQNVGDTEYFAVSMSIISGDEQSGDWTATIPAQTKTGTVHYFIRASDTSGNNATSPTMGSHSVLITGPPSIVIVNPKGGEIFSGGSIQQIEFAASDTEDSADDLTVFLNYTSGAEIVYITQIKGNDSPYPWLLPKINASDVEIVATVIDSDGNKAYAESPMFTIDSTPPRIVSTNPANNTTGISIFQPIIIQFSEPMNITSVVVNQTNGTDPGGWQWFWNETGNTLTGIHNAWPRGEVVEITVHAGYRDASEPGNANDTAYVFTFTTETNPPPEIAHANISGPQELGDSVRISATITDDGTVMNAVLWWRDVDGVWRESRMQKNGDDWFYLMPGQMVEGKVMYQINATDDFGQKNTTIIFEFDVMDSTPPVITHTPVVNAVIGESINITCLVTDLGGVDVVYLHYRNESEANFTVIAMNPGNWHELDARSLPVTIEYYLQALDIYGNEASTGIYSLEIIDPTVPDTTPPEVLFVGPTGASIPITTTISIVFSEAVDRASVENAITISSAVSGMTYTWLNDQTLVLAFDDLHYNTTYTVTIGTGATDLEGNALVSAYSWQFTTALEPEIVQQPAPNNWGWIGIIIFLSIIIALMLLYLFNKEKKEPDNTKKE